MSGKRRIGRVLVTGGAGFIGSHLCRRLLDEECEVIAFDNLLTGRIENIEVLSSSGHAVLDEAAIRIVRMAAPFDPFPAELRATTDVLEIIRTWKFRQNRLSSVQG